MTLEHKLSRAYGSGGSPIEVGGGGRQSVGSGPVERLSLIRPELPCPGCAHMAVCSIRPKLEGAIADIRTPASPHEAVTVAVSVAVMCRHYLAADVSIEREIIPDSIPTRPPKGVAAAMAASRQRGAKAGGFVAGAKKPLPLLRDVEAKLPATPAAERWAGPDPQLRDPEAIRPAAEQANAAARRRFGSKLPRDKTERNAAVLEALRSTPSVRDAGDRLGVSETRIHQVLGELRAAGSLPADITELLQMRRGVPRADRRSS